MRKISILILSILLLQGCTTSKITTDMGIKIGESFKEAAAKGDISAEGSIKAWPYVSGQIKGLMADNYKIEMVPMAQNIISRLDKLSKKEILTTEEKGFVIGSYVRLEAIALQFAWDKYGVSILSLVKKKMGG